MKKYLLFLVLFSFSKTKAQVVFCPPGAEWNYNFTASSSQQIVNEKVKYIKDTIIGLDTLKMLSSTRVFFNCNPTPIGTFKTLIKQKGDTVFFNNFSTQQSWQILYNFAAQPGQGWQTTYSNYWNTPTSVTHYFVVNSVSTVTINNTPLRQLQMGSDFITERFGWDKFLFSRLISSPCHADFFVRSLCYSDSTFGLKQFTAYPCDYSNLTDIKEQGSENNKIIFYPNPTSGILNFKSGHSEFPNAELIVSDLQGREQRSVKTNQSPELDLGDLEKGLYVATVIQNGQVVHTSKIIKQ